MKEKILIAKISAAHGLRGWLKLNIYSSSIDSFVQYNEFYDEKDNIFILEKWQKSVKYILVKFKDICDRSAAELLKGHKLYIKSDQLQKLNEDEYYHHDLLDAEVQNESGQIYGKLISVPDFGAGPLIELIDAEKNKHFLPFTKFYVPKLDLENKIIYISKEACALIEKLK